MSIIVVAYQGATIASRPSF